MNSTSTAAPIDETAEDLRQALAVVDVIRSAQALRPIFAGLDLKDEAAEALNVLALALDAIDAPSMVAGIESDAVKIAADAIAARAGGLRPSPMGDAFADVLVQLLRLTTTTAANWSRQVAHSAAAWRDAQWSDMLAAKLARLSKLEDVAERAGRLVDYADFQLGGALHAGSSRDDIPAAAVSSVKARHLASLRAALASLKASA